MFLTNSAIFLCLALVFFNLNLYHAKDVAPDTEKPNPTNIPLLSNRFPDLFNLFPNFNDAFGNQGTSQYDMNSGSQYPRNCLNNVNDACYAENPLSTFQGNNFPQYPVNNWNNYDNWNNNMYPGTYPQGPSYPNIQNPYFGEQNWNNGDGLQANQNPKQVMFPGNVVQPQGVPGWQSVSGQQNVIPNQGQTQYPQGGLEDYPGLQNGGLNPPQVSDGITYQLPNVEVQNPNLPYPQDDTTTTEKVAILGLPVIISTEPSVNIPTEPTTSLSTSTSAAMKQCTQDCKSTSEYNPVCGTNNVTYFNEGRIRCARICGVDVTELRKGACAVSLNPPPFM